MLRATPLALAVLLSACAPADPASSAAGAGAPIIDGTRETGHREVVMVARVNGSGAIVSFCSGTVIARRFVLTAKHCVFTETREDVWTATPVTRMRVLVGDDTTRPSGIELVVDVSEVWTTPGVYTSDDLSSGQDIAVIRTTEALSDVPIREIARGRARPGAAIEIVGFGRTVAGGGGSGRKFSGDTTIARVFRNLFQTSGMARTCSGDSGGPAIDAAGRVLGVTSFGVDEACREDMSFFTEVSVHVDLIEGALGREAPCTPAPGDEACDGADNDCDARVDEGCAGVGAECFRDEECDAGACLLVDGRPQCVIACEPASSGGCPAGFGCEVLGCNVGRCTELPAGGARVGASCRVHEDCASLYCFQELDGSRSCVARQCQDGGEACPEGLVCRTDGLPCGACKAPDPLDPLGLGEPCTEASSCESGDCHEEGYCTGSCARDADCPDAFYCGGDARCRRGDRVPPGGACEDDAECDDAAPRCHEIDGDRACVATCSEPTDCAMGEICDGGACVPEGLPLGEPCADHGQCRSGICAILCTRLCTLDAECPEGFECLPAGDQSGCFPPGGPPLPEPEPEPGAGGGCHASPGRPAAAAVFALAVVALRRRRGAARR